MTEREIRHVASKRHPETGFRCSSDPALVARVLKARRFHCIGEEAYRHGEEG